MSLPTVRPATERPTECSLCDELYTDLAWCEWCRTLICPDCVRIMARIPACNFSDYSELSDWRLSGASGVGVAVPLLEHVEKTRLCGVSLCRCRCEGVSLTGRSTRTQRIR